jgi:RNA polymerase sigma-70 factor (ECF subfamily)
LDGLLLELSDVQADAIRLRFFGQLKYREIADAMDSSLGAAKQRVKLGLIAIGEMLRDRALIDSVFPDTKP